MRKRRRTDSTIYVLQAHCIACRHSAEGVCWYHQNPDAYPVSGKWAKVKR